MKYKRLCAAILAFSVLFCGCQKPEQPDNLPETTAIIADSGNRTDTETQTDTALSAVVKSESFPMPENIYWLSQFQWMDGGLTAFGTEYADPKTHLIRYTEDLSDYTETILVRQAPYDGYYHTGCFLAIHEGTLYSLSVMENHSNMPPFEEGMEDYDWDTYNASWESDYYLCTYADDGTITSAVPIEGLEEYQSEQGYDQFSSIFADENGMYLMMVNGMILHISKDGTIKETHAPQIGGEILDGMGGMFFYDANGKAVCMQKFYCSDNTGGLFERMQLSEFDTETGTLSEPFFSVDLSGGMSRAWADTGFGEYRLTVSMEEKVIGIKADGTEETLIDWKASDMEEMTVFPLKDGTFLATGYSKDGEQILSRLTRKTVQEVQAVTKQELTLGLLCSEGAISDFVRTFNREHDDLKINVVSYADDEGYWDLDAFKLDIISGDAPDIILTHENHEAVRQLGKRGAFLDLHTFMASDTEVNTETVLPNILDAMSAENGALYSLPNGFAVATAAVRHAFATRSTGRWMI